MSPQPGKQEGGGVVRGIAQGSRDLSPTDRSPLAFAQRELAERWTLIERYAKADANPNCEGCDGEGIDWEGSEWTLCDEPSCALVKLRAREAVR